MTTDPETRIAELHRQLGRAIRTIRPLLSTTFTQVDHLTPTDRADGGFGSTAH
jgi:dUTPase